MNKSIEMDIRGIKCDACDWDDMSVNVEDYHDWLNKPCPECGANLLTEADYEMVQQMMGFADFVNDVLPPDVLEAYGFDMSAEDVVVAFDADGSGKLNPRIVTDEQEK